MKQLYSILSSLPHFVRSTLLSTCLCLLVGSHHAAAQAQLPAPQAATTALETEIQSEIQEAAPQSAVERAVAEKIWEKPTEFVTVKKGDTAYALAHAHGLEVDELLAINHLSSHDLEVGQTLRVMALPPYQVSRGDTVYSLAKKHGVTVADLLALNHLGEDAHIEVGQWLTFPATSPTANDTVASTAFSAVTEGAGHTPQPHWTRELRTQLPETQSWRSHALALLGTPYVYGGTTERGLDCSAFVQRVFQPLGVSLPRTSAAQAGVGLPVSRHALRAGDLIFFDTVGSGNVTHVGIYLGDGEFVNANSYLGKVAIDQLSSQYWNPRYLTARRVLATEVQAQASARTNP